MTLLQPSYLLLFLAFFLRNSAAVVGDERQLKSQVPDARRELSESSLPTNQRRFADELTATLYDSTSPPENDCTSALGISMAFSLVYPSMIDDSLSETQTVFGYPNKDDSSSQQQLVWQETTNALTDKYQGTCLMQGDENEGCLRNEPIVAIANSVWVEEKDLTDDDLSSYLMAVEDVLFPIQFQEDGAADKINTWVNDTSRGLIPEIVQQDDLQNLVLLAVNSLYIKANWHKAFLTSKTNADNFYTSTDRSALVSSETHFMHTVEFYLYSDTALPGYQVLKMPFMADGNDDLSFVVVLPNNNNDALVASERLVTDALPQLQTERIALALPKFAIQKTYRDALKASLQALGLVAPFRGGLCIFDDTVCDGLVEFVIQKTFIGIDEEGVEAAAVTAVGASRASAPTGTPKLFMADHPFQFFIYDDATQVVLMEGRVGNPTVPPQSSEPLLTATSHDESNFWLDHFGVTPVEVPPNDNNNNNDSSNTASNSNSMTESNSSSGCRRRGRGFLLLSAALLGLVIFIL